MYVAYWIPTKHYIDITIPNRKRIFNVNFSDIETEDLFVNIFLVFDKNKPIRIEIEDNKSNLLGLIEIKEFFKNGILVGEIKKGKDKLLISNALYHEMKEFYHNHEHHDKNEDTLLTPYIFHDESLLNDKYKLLKEVIKHYINLFENKFIHFKRKLEIDLEKLEDAEKNFFNLKDILTSLFNNKKRENIFKAINSNIPKIHAVFSRINGEKEYYEFLKDVYLREIPQSSKSKEIDKIIEKIDKSLEEINSIREKFNYISNRLELKKSDINFKIAIISFIMAIISSIPLIKSVFLYIISTIQRIFF